MTCLRHILAKQSCQTVISLGRQTNSNTTIVIIHLCIIYHWYITVLEILMYNTENNNSTATHICMFDLLKFLSGTSISTHFVASVSLWLIPLKEQSSNFEYIAFFLVSTKDKTTLTRKNWENRVLKVRLTKYCYLYYIYITWTDFEHHYSQLLWVRVDLSRWTFYYV